MKLFKWRERSRPSRFSLWIGEGNIMQHKGSLKSGDVRSAPPALGQLRDGATPEEQRILYSMMLHWQLPKITLGLLTHMPQSHLSLEDKSAPRTRAAAGVVTR